MNDKPTEKDKMKYQKTNEPQQIRIPKSEIQNTPFRNALKAVFWDYPQFTDDQTLRNFLTQNKEGQRFLWALRRFLEHGRVIDTLYYFKISDIARHVSKLNLRAYTLKKWQRMIQVYGESD